ncbi:MAG: sugar phosphate nucleotidyltransferase [bacterium]|nr:sugar phosphate nucleotidyltransferase [bacterium]
MLKLHLPIHGILLLGGRGTRMSGLTSITNKHLLVVGGKFVAEYAIGFLLKCGIHDITMVINPEDESLYSDLLQRNQYALSANTVVQEQPLGTAHAVSLCEPSIQHASVATLWGDNLFEFALRKSCEDFLRQAETCRVHLATVPNPQDFGVAILQEGRIVAIEDKPLVSRASTVCTGFMLFRSTVFSKLSGIQPNHKQERDIMDVVRQYLAVNALTHTHIEGRWLDIGTCPEAYQTACSLVQNCGVNKCPHTERIINQ